MARVPLPPHVKQLTLRFDVPQAIVIPGEPAPGVGVWIQEIKLLCDAVEVSSHKQLAVLGKVG
jgi:hypothetical protein